MSRKNRKKGPRPGAMETQQIQPVAAAMFGSVGVGGGGFQGAGWSKNRGYVYFPTLDTRFEVNAYNRTELMRRARFLYANVGLARRVVNGMARMIVGRTGLMPRPITTDEEWNAAALANFRDRANSPYAWHTAEKHTFAAMQRALVRCGKKDGDAFVPLTESLSGRARFGFYEAHQVGSTWRVAENEGWIDGVWSNPEGAPRYYRVLKDADGSVSIPAHSMVHYADFERAGQRRGLTCFYHAVNNLIDLTEISSFLKQGIKTANRVGYYFVDKGAPAGSGSIAEAFAQNRKLVEYGDKKFQVEQVYGDGGEIPDVPPGKELRLLADSRPHPNTMGFAEFLIRDIAWGCGLSPEVIWNIAVLGGANTRFALADAQAFIEEEQQLLVDNFCQRAYVYTLAKDMKAGRLRDCRDPEWWKVAWIPPARMTVDFGRDGKLMLDQMKRGALTFRRMYQVQGLDAWPELKERIDELAKIKRYATEQGLTPQEYHPLMGIDNTAASPEPEVDAEEEEELGRERERVAA